MILQNSDITWQPKTIEDIYNDMRKNIPEGYYPNPWAFVILPESKDE